MVIVGLIVAGVTAGGSLIRSAEVNKIVSEINGYKTAHNAFQLKYDAFAGDFDEANDYWSETASGNGDNQVNIAAEYHDYWQQLYLAELIGLNATGSGTVNATDGYVGGINAPAASIDSYKYSIMWQGGLNFPNAHWMFMTSTSESSPIDDISVVPNGVNASEAISIDKKIDDGIAYTGNVVAAICTGGGYAFSEEFTHGDNSYAYNKDSTVSCEMAFKF